MKKAHRGHFESTPSPKGVSVPRPGTRGLPKTLPKTTRGLMLKRRQSQRQAGTDPGRSEEARTASQLEIARDGISGRPSEVPARTRMEQAFGTSFADVRAHTGPEAARACASMNALGYTLGTDVAFATSSPDEHTVAHELAHVVQQSGEREQVQAKRISGAGDLEAQADAAADAVVSGNPVGRLGSSETGVQRQALAEEASQEEVEPAPMPRDRALRGLQEAHGWANENLAEQPDLSSWFSGSEEHFLEWAEWARERTRDFEQGWGGFHWTGVSRRVHETRQPIYHDEMQRYNSLALRVNSEQGQLDSALAITMYAERSYFSTFLFLESQGLASFGDDNRPAFDIDELMAQASAFEDVLATSPKQLAGQALATKLAGLPAKLGNVRRAQHGFTAALARARAAAARESVSADEDRLQQINQVIETFDQISSAIEATVKKVGAVDKLTREGVQFDRELAGDAAQRAGSLLGTTIELAYWDEIQDLRATIGAAESQASGLEALAHIEDMRAQQLDFEVSLMELTVQLQEIEQAAREQEAELAEVGRFRDDADRRLGLLSEDEERYDAVARHLAKVLESYQLCDAAVDPLEHSVDSLGGFANEIRAFSQGSTGLSELNRGRSRQLPQEEHFRGMAIFLRREVLGKLRQNRASLGPVARALEELIACRTSDPGDFQCD